ncbi:MAG: FtsW/RodA/SpoVE family cell cycle protein, partial [Saprospiraceae bacterium]|nr:FtsW/RodA/SpoVE family cell cycle protein [Saprospiraceae bacterium]
MSIGTRIYAELKGDRVIWMIVAVLALFSVLAVYSATGTLAYRERGGNTEAYLLKHGFILGLGLFITYLCYLIHYTRYKQMAPWLMVIAIPLLMYTIFLGEDINNARRWIELPFVGITFQTSDFAKLALIIFVAREITRHKDYIKDFNKAFLPILVPIVIICGLIAPADLSTALILFTTSV